MATWADLKEYQIEFWLLKDDNEIVVVIYNTKQAKDKTIQGYGQQLKGLVVKMESPLANGLKKRWFMRD